jgi:hypothetical protein
MGKISSYPEPTPPALDDFLIGTDVSQSDATKNFVISDILNLFFSGLPLYANNAAALVGGLLVGNGYKTATGEVRVVV